MAFKDNNKILSTSNLHLITMHALYLKVSKSKKSVDLLDLEMTCTVVRQHVSKIWFLSFIQALDFMVPCGTELQETCIMDWNRLRSVWEIGDKQLT